MFGRILALLGVLAVLAGAVPAQAQLTGHAPRAVALRTAPAVTAIVTTTLSGTDKSSLITLSNGNLTAEKNAGSGWVSARSVACPSTGKYYWEATNVTSGVAVAAGIGTPTATLSNFPGNADALGVGWPSNDTNFYANSGGTGTVGGATWNAATNGIDIAEDLDNHKVWFRNRGGANWNNDVLANQNPATNTGGFTLTGSLASGAICAMVSAFSVTAPDKITVNFGATAFADTPPAGFGKLH